MNTTKKQPWPTKDAMDQVYKLKLWGSNSSKFYSGEGSHLPEIVNPYISSITSFLKSFTPPLIICDLGCGDFNIGKELVPYTKKYFAIDIVQELIDYNKEKFKGENLEFLCLDIGADKIPSGDCAIIRQVLQHLSNKEVQTIVNKLSNFKYVILTEHLPIGDFEPNIDIISGQGIRIKKQSGIKLTSPPFNFKANEEKELLTIDLKDGKGIIVTTLYIL
jgi:hypothetical protein